MLKKILIVTTFSISLFSANLDSLIAQLSKFQEKLNQKNLNYSEDKRIQEMQKKLDLLNAKLNYEETLNNIEESKQNTIQFYKDLAKYFYYNIEDLFKDKTYIVNLKGTSKVFNKKYYVLTQNDYNNLISSIIKNKEIFDSIRTKYYILQKRPKKDFLEAFVSKLNDILDSYEKYTNISENKDYSYSSDNPDRITISLRELKSYCKSVKKRGDLLVLKRCSFE